MNANKVTSPPPLPPRTVEAPSRAPIVEIKPVAAKVALAASVTSKKNFIDTLQELDEPMKRRVLIGGSVIAMIAIVYIWIGYLNTIVMQNPASNQNAANSAANDGSSIAIPATPAPSLSANAAQNTPGFWSELGGGLAALYHDTANSIGYLDGSFNHSKEYNVTPNSGTQSQSQ